VKYYNWKVI